VLVRRHWPTGFTLQPLHHKLWPLGRPLILKLPFLCVGLWRRLQSTPRLIPARASKYAFYVQVLKPGPRHNRRQEAAGLNACVRWRLWWRISLRMPWFQRFFRFVRAALKAASHHIPLSLLLVRYCLHSCKLYRHLAQPQISCCLSKVGIRLSEHCISSNDVISTARRCTDFRRQYPEVDCRAALGVTHFGCN